MEITLKCQCWIGFTYFLHLQLMIGWLNVAGNVQGAMLLQRSQCDNVVRFLAFDSGAAGRMQMPGKARIVTEWMPKTLLDVILMCRKVLPILLCKQVHLAGNNRAKIPSKLVVQVTQPNLPNADPLDRAVQHCDWYMCVFSTSTSAT